MRPPALAALALVAVALAAVLAPLAEADHAYSHRYLVYGRVVDARGLPVAEARVDVGFTSEARPSGLCSPDQRADGRTAAWGETLTRAVTNAAGEYLVCFHLHALPAGSEARVMATHGGHDATARVDADFRKTFLHLVVPDGSGAASEAMDATYLVSGRLWARGPRSVEGVPVQGDAVAGESVRVAFETPGGGSVFAETRSNDYGDFAVRLNASRALGAGTIVVEALGERYTQAADARLRWTDFDVEAGVPGVAGEPAATPPPAGAAADPTPAPMPIPAALALAALAAAAQVGRRR